MPEAKQSQEGLTVLMQQLHGIDATVRYMLSTRKEQVEPTGMVGTPDAPMGPDAAIQAMKAYRPGTRFIVLTMAGDRFDSQAHFLYAYLLDGKVTFLDYQKDLLYTRSTGRLRPGKERGLDNPPPGPDVGLKTARGEYPAKVIFMGYVPALVTLEKMEKQETL